MYVAYTRLVPVGLNLKNAYIHTAALETALISTGANGKACAPHNAAGEQAAIGARGGGKAVLICLAACE